MELTEFEERAINACRRYRMDDDYAMEDFVEDIRKIMPPTCTLIERKFLDEVMGKAKLIRPNVYVINLEPNKISSVIFAKDFEANLSELVEGKQ